MGEMCGQTPNQTDHWTYHPECPQPKNNEAHKATQHHKSPARSKATHRFMQLKRDATSRWTAKPLIKTRASLFINFLAMTSCSSNSLKISMPTKSLVSNIELDLTPPIVLCLVYKSHKKVKCQAHARPAQSALSARLDLLKGLTQRWSIIFIASAKIVTQTPFYSTLIRSQRKSHKIASSSRSMS